VLAVRVDMVVTIPKTIRDGILIGWPADRGIGRHGLRRCRNGGQRVARMG